MQLNETAVRTGASGAQLPPSPAAGAGDPALAGIMDELKAMHRTLRDVRRDLDLARAELRRLASRKPWPRRVFRAVRNFVRKPFKPRLGILVQHRPKKWPANPLAGLKAPADAPTISIVTPSFRQAKYIVRTIESVLGQNYPALEYFVQDGGSDDGTVDILKSYDGRLSGWVSQRDSGQSQAINLGFARTSGDIMAWLNSDDMLVPGALAFVGSWFKAHPDVDVIYGDRINIDAQDGCIGRWIMPAHDNEILSWADFVPQETMFWRRSLWDKAGGIDESFRFAMDWDLILRFRAAGAKFVHVPHFLGAFRIHDTQKTQAEMAAAGEQEMQRLRLRTLGTQPGHREILRRAKPYIRAHVRAEQRYMLGLPRG